MVYSARGQDPNGNLVFFSKLYLYCYWLRPSKKSEKKIGMFFGCFFLIFFWIFFWMFLSKKKSKKIWVLSCNKSGKKYPIKYPEKNPNKDKKILGFFFQIFLDGRRLYLGLKTQNLKNN